MNPYKMRLFSLVELFIVIAILAILSSLTIPALQNIQSMNDQVISSKNFKGAYLAFQHFANDHDDWILGHGTTWSSEQGYQFNNEGITRTIRWELAYDAVIFFEGYLTREETKSVFHIVELDKHYETFPNRLPNNMGKSAKLGFESARGARRFKEIESPSRTMLFSESLLQPNGVWYWRDRSDIASFEHPLQYRKGERYFSYSDGHLESHFYSSMSRTNLSLDDWQKLYFGFLVW